MLETLADPVEEIRQIATEFLQEVVLCDNASFEVAGHLRHDNPQIRSMARELLLSNGQEDLIKKMNE